jgi:lysophospholipase L1-like esterase
VRARWGRVLGVCLLTVLVMFGSGELATRLIVEPRISGDITVEKPGIGQDTSTGLYMTDRRLGWVLTPGVEVRHRTVEYSAIYQIDPEGNRLIRRSDAASPLIKFYGDSIVFGIGVNNHESMPGYLAELLPSMNVTNRAVPGYSPDQYYLSFTADLAERRRPDAAIFGIFPENDLEELTRDSVYDPGNGYKTKPILVPSNGSFQFAFPERDFVATPEEPLPTITTVLKRSYLVNLFYAHGLLIPGFGFLAEGARELGLTEANLSMAEAGLTRLDWLVDQISATDVPAIYLIVPARDAFQTRSERSMKVIRYSMTKELLAHKGVPFVDLLTAFPRDSAPYFPLDGHLNATGNELAARAVAPLVTEWASESHRKDRR